MSLQSFIDEPAHIGQLRETIARFVAEKAPREARIAWDRSSGPHAGRVYMVYMAAPTSNVPGALLDDTDIKVFFSDNNGQSWSDDVTVAVSDENVPSRHLRPVQVAPVSAAPVVALTPAKHRICPATFLRSMDACS